MDSWKMHKIGPGMSWKTTLSVEYAPYACLLFACLLVLEDLLWDSKWWIMFWRPCTAVVDDVVGADAVCRADGPISVQCRCTRSLVWPVQCQALVPRIRRWSYSLAVSFFVNGSFAAFHRSLVIWLVRLFRNEVYCILLMATAYMALVLIVLSFIAQENVTLGTGWTFL